MSEGREIAFPLPLAPFEEYMLGDDHSAYPMVFFLRLRFSGRIDETSFETAYQAAVSRHSLLRAILASKGKRNLEWVESDQLPSIRWVERGNSDALPRACAYPWSSWVASSLDVRRIEASRSPTTSLAATIVIPTTSIFVTTFGVGISR